MDLHLDGGQRHPQRSRNLLVRELILSPHQERASVRLRQSLKRAKHGSQTLAAVE
jgi:hypothetical protein